MRKFRVGVLLVLVIGSAEVFTVGCYDFPDVPESMASASTAGEGLSSTKGDGATTTDDGSGTVSTTNSGTDPSTTTTTSDATSTAGSESTTGTTSEITTLDPGETDSLEMCDCPECDYTCIANCKFSSCKHIVQETSCSPSFENGLFQVTRLVGNQDTQVYVWCDGEWTYKPVRRESMEVNYRFASMADSECEENYNMRLFYPTTELHSESAIWLAKRLAEMNGELDLIYEGRSHIRIMGIEETDFFESCHQEGFNSDDCDAWSPFEGVAAQWFVRDVGIDQPKDNNTLLPSTPIYFYLGDDDKILYETPANIYLSRSSRFFCTVYPSDDVQD